MGANYVKLETITVGEAGASSVTFNNIPQSGYTDLKIVASARTNRGTYGTDAIWIKLNGSSTGYSGKQLYGFGTTITSNSTTNPLENYAGATDAINTANTFSNIEWYIPNYTSSNYKSVSSDGSAEDNSSANNMNTLAASLWSNTAAITSATLIPGYGTAFAQYSTFSLYGLAAVGTTPVIAPYASGGDIIQTDGTYWYHAFLSSGTFTPTKNLSCDYLVVAGGGGGGNTVVYDGGGGGAGGLRAFAAQALNANTAQTVTVGAGGTAGTNGSNTTFNSTSVTGGGFGGSSGNGGNGGSGGGGGGRSTGLGGTGNAGSYSPVEGYAGGDHSGGGWNEGGGGGGAGGAGYTAPPDGSGGNGGPGANSYNSITFTSWLSTTGLGVSGYLAGGGGSGAGGTGGSGGGGGASTVGKANTGSGGGGSTGSSAAKGGSGLVIVRYAV